MKEKEIDREGMAEGLTNTQTKLTCLSL